jgi:hypothetical protein
VSELHEQMIGKLPYKGRRLGRLIVTSVRQPTSRRFIDGAWTHDADGNMYVSKTFLLTPWRKNTHGEYVRQKALVVGWRRDN